MKVLDWVLFSIVCINVLYLFVFALASLHKKAIPQHVIQTIRRLAVIIPAYKEDAVIEECVLSCLAQNYPTDAVTLVVVSDHMKESTNQRLSELPIRLMIAHYTESTKSKALNLAMSQLDDHDIVVVFDADNTLPPDYFRRINEAFEAPTVQLVQTHRVAKNFNNNMAILDAISEESNNSIFRQGHYTLGLSAALIGSGMAFDYVLFKEKMKTIHAVGGFDRNLELSFLKDGKRIHYLHDVYVYDEKVQDSQTFSNQRRRWLSAQIHYFKEFSKDFPKALLHGNLDFCIKYLQQLAIPRVLLVGVIPLYALLATLIAPLAALKWWLLFIVLGVTLWLAIPRYLLSKQLVKALVELPTVFLSMVKNLFRLKGANKQFIHTKHGIN